MMKHSYVEQEGRIFCSERVKGINDPGNIKATDGGGGEIRTHGRVAPTTIFKTVAFNHSATPPVRDGSYYTSEIPPRGSAGVSNFTGNSHQATLTGPLFPLDT